MNAPITEEKPGNTRPLEAEFALELLHITKEFPGVRALNDATFQVRRGEIHALIGENGAGKSTLMKILDGVYPHGSYKGEIRIKGVPVAFRSPHDAKNKGIGFVPQEINVIEGLSIAENIFVGEWTGGRVVRFGELFENARKLLDQMGSPLNPRQTVAKLNTSQRQLVMIARALASNPAVLILDEPTSALTQSEVDNLFSIVRALKERGGTIVLITHKMQEIFDLADRATVLRDGSVVGNFSRAEFNPGEIITAMVGRKMESLFPPRESEIGTDEVLRVENLTVADPHVARRNVVENISFSVKRGEILGIGGLVGSGRSEIVNALYGRTPYSGTIHVEGKAVTIANSRSAKAAGIGLVSEDRKQEGLLFNFDIRQNISVNHFPEISRHGVLRKSREREVAMDFFKELGIRAPSIHTMVGSLSGGNQQKVVLAKVLLPKPKILLLDEPTKGVDVGAKYEIYKFMMALVKAGVSLVFISSELPELMALSDRFIVLCGGKIRDTFPKSEASEHRIMRAATGFE